MENQLLTRDEAAKLLRVGKSKIDTEIEEGRLECFRFGRLVRISPDQLDDYLARSSTRALSSNASEGI